jgi:hypothetical protein
MRVVLGILVAAVALVAANHLHGLRPRLVKQSASGGSVYLEVQVVNKPQSWQNPVALAVAIVGVGAGLTIVRPAIRPKAH